MQVKTDRFLIASSISVKNLNALSPMKITSTTADANGDTGMAIFSVKSFEHFQI